MKLKIFESLENQGILVKRKRDKIGTFILYAILVFLVIHVCLIHTLPAIISAFIIGLIVIFEIKDGTKWFIIKFPKENISKQNLIRVTDKNKSVRYFSYSTEEEKELILELEYKNTENLEIENIGVVEKY